MTKIIATNCSILSWSDMSWIGNTGKHFFQKVLNSAMNKYLTVYTAKACNHYRNFRYIWWLLKFVGMFFCGKLTKPCRHARTFQLVSPVAMPELSNWSALLPCQNFPTGQPCRHARTFQLVSQQSLASINNKNPNILTKWPPVANTFPSGTQRHHWGIGIPGIPSDLRSRLEQSHHLRGALLSRWLQAVYSLQWASLPSTLQKRCIHSLFMIVFWKRCVIWRKLSLWTSN